MKRLLFGLLVVGVVSAANAALLEHLTFDAASSDVVLGSAASIDTATAVAGTGSLKLVGNGLTEEGPHGNDGAVTTAMFGIMSLPA